MKKILLLQGPQVDKFCELLTLMADTTDVGIELHSSLTIVSDKPEILDAVKTMFGGEYFYDGERLSAHVTVDTDDFMATIREAQDRIYEIGSTLPNEPVQLNNEFLHIRDQVNEKIDQIVTAQDAEFLSTVPLATAPPLKVKKKPLVKMPQTKPSKEIKAWHVIVNGKKTEIITISEKNRRLAAGEFETGTQLRHPKAGLQRVTGEKGQPQGMESIE